MTEDDAIHDSDDSSGADSILEGKTGCLVLALFFLWGVWYFFSYRDESYQETSSTIIETPLTTEPSQTPEPMPDSVEDLDMEPF